MSFAFRVYQAGGPEVLSWEEAPTVTPGKGEVLIRHEAVGLNFIDIYHRSGLFAMPMPTGIGIEGVGIVEALGEGAALFELGDRVGYASGPLGAYSQWRTIPAERLIKLPDAINSKTAAGMMLKGLTAAYLMHRVFPVKAGNTILMHAAAGGVGLIICQWAKTLGAQVIGTVSTEEKAALACQHGCDHIIFYDKEDIVGRVREITDGAGVDVVFDGVGKKTFTASFDCLRVRGMLVSLGNASGPVEPVSPLLLKDKGSLFLTRPTLAHYIAKRDEMLDLADKLFSVVTSGKVKIKIGQTYALSDSASAHRDLEAGNTTGSTIMLP